jgi:hypothetical protein
MFMSCPVYAELKNMNNIQHSDIDINSGTIDGTAIGLDTKLTGAFTTLSADSTTKISDGTPWDLADSTYTGSTVIGKAHETLIFGDVCFMDSDGEYAKAQANSATTMPGLVMSVANIAANAYGVFLQRGYACEAVWSTVQTKGALVYVDDDTAGLPTTTIPPDTGDQVQIIGYCVGTDIFYFSPDYTIVEQP